MAEEKQKRKLSIGKLILGYFGVSFIFGSIVIFSMDIQNTTLLDFFMTAMIFIIGILFMSFAIKPSKQKLHETVIDDEYRPQQENKYTVDEFADMVGNTKNQEKRKWSARKLLLSFLFTIFGVPCIMLSIFAFYTEKPTTADAIIPFSIIGLLGIFFLYLAVKSGKHKSSETVVYDVYRPQQEVRYAVDEFADTAETQNYETANSTESNEQKQPNTSGNEIELWTTAQAVTFVIGIIVFVINFVLCCKKGFSYMLFKGVGIMFVSMLLVIIPYAIYEKKYEKTLPPHLLAAIEEAARKEMEENRQRERERAERRADTFNSLLWYHIFFGRRK